MRMTVGWHNMYDWIFTQRPNFENGNCILTGPGCELLRNPVHPDTQAVKPSCLSLWDSPQGVKTLYKVWHHIVSIFLTLSQKSTESFWYCLQIWQHTAYWTYLSTGIKRARTTWRSLTLKATFLTMVSLESCTESTAMHSMLTWPTEHQR